MVENAYYSVKALCEHIGIGRTTAYKLFADGHVKTIHLGRRRLVDRASVTSFLQRVATEEGE